MSKPEDRRIARRVKAALKEHFVEVGRKGGAAGTGAAKRRGGSIFYSKLAQKRWSKDK